MEWEKWVLALFLCITYLLSSACAGPFIRGDCNGDGRVDLADIVCVLGYLYRGKSEPSCLDALDVDDNGSLSVSDALRLIRFLFENKDPPSEPFPEAGFDPTGNDPFTCGDRNLPEARYIRWDAPAGGKGLTWKDAFREFPPYLERGVTYYVASGFYPALKIRSSDKSQATITIKRPSKADHGTDIGWKEEYAEGSAVFPSVAFEESYVVFDGVFGSEEKGNYGFEIYNEAEPTKMIWLITISKGVTDVIIRKVEAHRPSRKHRGRGLYAAFGESGNINLSHSYFHDFHGVHCYFLNAREILIEGCIFARNNSTPELHSESIQARGTVGLTVRYCLFEDIQGTAVIVSGSGDSSRWRIYGNVFRSTAGFKGGTGHGTIADNFRGSISDVIVCNNTFLNIRAGKTGVRFFNGEKDLFSFNNLYVNCTGVGYVKVRHDYDLFVDCQYKKIELSPSEHDVFLNGVDIVSEDGRLKGPTPPGKALPPPLNMDPEGRRRGADGVWDRGAYEFSSLKFSPSELNDSKTEGP